MDSCLKIMDMINWECFHLDDAHNLTLDWLKLAKSHADIKAEGKEQAAKKEGVNTAVENVKRRK